MNIFLYSIALVICTGESKFGPKCVCQRKPVPTPGQPCANNQTCVPIGQNFVCYNWQCLCTPGFHLNNGQCQEECNTYSSTYTKYVRLDVQCTAQEPAPGVTTVSDCQLACDGTPVCLSFTFDENVNFPCIIRSCDPLNDIEDPAFTPIVNTDPPATTSLFVKNCA